MRLSKDILINSERFFIPYNVEKKSSKFGWKLSIRGKSIDDSFEIYSRIHKYLDDNNIQYKVGTQKLVNTISAQRFKLMTVYVPDDISHLTLAEIIYTTYLMDYKGWYNIKEPNNYEFYAGGIYFRNDRDIFGQYIPCYSSF